MQQNESPYLRSTGDKVCQRFALRDRAVTVQDLCFLTNICKTLKFTRHEQVCLMRLRFARYFSLNWTDDGEVSLKT